jgi:KaiC/GvpD/RAD55 family RecA-like ATPase
MSFEDELREIPPPPDEKPSDQWLTLDAVIASMANDGDPVPTGWAPLDRQLRNGGVTPGRIVTIGGPPFSGKTTVVAAIALHVAQRIPVFALFSDEGRSQAGIRMGVQLGAPLADLERDPANAAKLIRDELLGERTLHLSKPDTEEATAEAVVAYARKHVPAGSPAMIVLDSAQTIPKGAETAEDNPRLALKAFMKSCRAWAADLGWIFLLTSQSNRASYRHKRGEENSLAIASFSESAAVEFLSDVALVLGTPSEQEIVPVEFVKNRLKGTKKNFNVRYDEATGRMLEVDGATASDQKEKIKSEQHERTISNLADAILAQLRKRGGLSGRQVAELVGGKSVNVPIALRGLEQQGVVEPEPGPHRSLIWRIKKSE